MARLLRPQMLDDLGLEPTLRWLARTVEKRTGVAVELEVAGSDEGGDKDAETLVFRIVQEALTNIQRHSGSTVARIRLEKEQNEIRLEIEDDGRGLPEDLREKTALTAAGVGMAAIQQRVRELGGQLQIQSRERGTSIVVTMPILEK